VMTPRREEHPSVLSSGFIIEVMERGETRVCRSEREADCESAVLKSLSVCSVQIFTLTYSCRMSAVGTPHSSHPRVTAVQQYRAYCAAA
jgi:hypothetical protein